MKIQRYTAPSMRAALAQIRAEQGPDAVILSSRRIEDGIEVIAAVDYDESLMPQLMRPRAAEAAPEPAPPAGRVKAPTAERVKAPPAERVQAPPAQRVQAPAAERVEAPAAERVHAPPAAAVAAAVASAAASTGSADYGAIRRDIDDMRRLLEGELATLTGNTRRRREPLKARVLEALQALDLAPDVARALAEHTPLAAQIRDPAHIPLALLARQLAVVDDQTCISGGVLVVVGPTGVGKTTTIAKLAARWSMLHGSDELALVSTDGYRIGGREQLLTYARILGAPLHAADGGKELAQVLARLKSKKLILIDTAGMGPRDARLAEQLSALQHGAARARVLLALPAHGEAHALEQIVRGFAGVSPAACVITKIDEAASLGAVLSTTLRHRLPIAYLCNGQRVPEDLHAAHLRKVWLVKTAAQLVRLAAPRRDVAHLAQLAGGGQAHV
jgi:flagellar biosynthesis protein FlhF